MKPKYLLLVLLLTCLVCTGWTQTKGKQNPVLFADVSVGHSGGQAGGFTGGASLYFQKESSLFTVRFTGTSRLHAKIASAIIPLPVIDNRSSLDELGLLYGKRIIRNACAYNVSLGVSHSTHRQVVSTSPVRQTQTTAAWGVPFEAGIKWFKPRKKRFRIYGLIPVGKPTGFGGSIGLKLLGTISQNSYAGITFSYGLGFHKQYE
ncbi:MAG TPA: hypothetical protein VGN63_02875 [Flavisolibacter sp.]|jgi:hypothetical protein|nr:hypothetical protein [Flavisolibacter sp.]